MQQADLFGSLIFLLVAVIWIVGAIRQALNAVRARSQIAADAAGAAVARPDTARPQRLAGPQRARRPARVTVAEAPRAPAQTQGVGPVLTREPMPGMEPEEPSPIGEWLLSSFRNPAGITGAMVASVILGPCAAHKGAGHVPGDW